LNENMTIKLNEYLLNWMNIAIKLNKYINIEYCNNRRAIASQVSIW
jgi:hypothetical protein